MLLPNFLEKTYIIAEKAITSEALCSRTTISCFDGGRVRKWGRVRRWGFGLGGRGRIVTIPRAKVMETVGNTLIDI